MGAPLKTLFCMNNVIQFASGDIGIDLLYVFWCADLKSDLNLSDILVQITLLSTNLGVDLFFITY